MTRLQVEIRCEKNSVHTQYLRKFEFQFFVPQSSVKGTLRIVKERLARDFEKNPILSPIEGLSTQVLKMVQAQTGQRNIFNNDEEKLEQIYSVHNQLQEILGADNVYHAELTEDRRPERSWKKSATSPHEKTIVPENLEHIIPRRATYLCRYPMKVSVTAGYIFIRDRKYKIMHWDNQIEKIAGGWFEKPSDLAMNTFDRIYSNVEIEGHQRLTIFQTPNRDYYLHGYDG